MIGFTILGMTVSLFLVFLLIFLFLLIFNALCGFEYETSCTISIILTLFLCSFILAAALYMIGNEIGSKDTGEAVSTNTVRVEDIAET